MALSSVVPPGNNLRWNVGPVLLAAINRIECFGILGENAGLMKRGVHFFAPPAITNEWREPSKHYETKVRRAAWGASAE